MKAYAKAKSYVAKTRGYEEYNDHGERAAIDAIERHDRRHPDRKIVESFDVSEFE